MTSAILRLVAFAIAIAGFIDPAIAVSGATRARLAVVAPAQPSPGASEIRDRLRRDLSGSFDLASSVTSDAAAAIVIGEQYPDEPLPETLLVATVTVPAAVAAGARIVRVGAAREVPSATLIRLDVDLEAAGLAGQTTEVTASIAGLEAGRASHRWGSHETRVRVSLDAVPIGDPPYSVRVRLKPDTTETADRVPVVSGLSRTAADIVVDLRRGPFRVQFYDPRPSWATTFLRRALEGDARFQVATLSFTSRGISAQAGGAVALGDPRLDAVAVVIVGGLDRLSAADARSLERFMRERGGAVVVVPDQRIGSGPADTLVSGSVRLQPAFGERLLEQPATLAVAAPAASFSASELLVLNTVMPGADVIARLPGTESAGTPGAPVVVSMPRGDGRLLVSGAMDAWRFRAADNGAFDRFWRSTIAGLALAVPPPIAMSFEPPLLRPGERGEAIVRIGSREVSGVSASLDGEPVRLRPDPEAGVYRGSVVARGTPGRSMFTVRAGAGQAMVASRALVVQSDVRRVRSAPALSMLASSHRGIDVTPDRVVNLERFIRDSVASPRAVHTRYPMRSVWWFLPFAVCLCAEWWLRRRRGLR